MNHNFSRKGIHRLATPASVVWSCLVAAVALLAGLASNASAETILGQWNANGGIAGGPAYAAASSGSNMATGTIGGYGGGAPTAPLSSTLINGAASDAGTVITGTTYNRSYSVNPPLLNVANNSVGMTFRLSTAGMSAGQAVKLSWSQSVGYRSSRFWQILVSTTGGTTGYSLPSGGLGSSISQSIAGMTSGSGALSGTATVSVSSSGLIDFRTLNNLSLAPAAITTSGTPANYAAGFVDNISYTLPTGLGYENNANFAFAIVGAWDPGLSATSGSTGLLSSFAGTDASDVNNGYNRALGSGGSMRLDLMTVSAVTAVPEPTACAMALAGIACGGYSMWRRRKRA